MTVARQLERVNKSFTAKGAGGLLLTARYAQISGQANSFQNLIFCGQTNLKRRRKTNRTSTRAKNPHRRHNTATGYKKANR